MILWLHLYHMLSLKCIFYFSIHSIPSVNYWISQRILMMLYIPILYSDNYSLLCISFYYSFFIHCISFTSFSICIYCRTDVVFLLSLFQVVSIHVVILLQWNLFIENLKVLIISQIDSFCRCCLYNSYSFYPQWETNSHFRSLLRGHFKRAAILTTGSLNSSSKFDCMSWKHILDHRDGFSRHLK